MSARTILFLQFATVAALAAIHVFGIAYYWYWEWRWLDIPTHFLGGVWAGLFILWAGALLSRRITLGQCVALGVLIGVVWEIFEFAIGAVHLPMEAFDTALDLLMDAAGVGGAWIFVRFAGRNVQNSPQK